MKHLTDIENTIDPEILNEFEEHHQIEAGKTHVVIDLAKTSNASGIPVSIGTSSTSNMQPPKTKVPSTGRFF